MKRTLACFLLYSLLVSLAACAGAPQAPADPADSAAAEATPTPDAETPQVQIPDGTAIRLSDDGTTVDGQPIPEDDSAAVYAARDIVFYQEGQDFTYGEGTAQDEHSAAEAAAHTVVHITAPGVYVLSGTLSAGQIAVDLGEEAEDDPEAVVSLVLDGAQITCTVAPAIIFYNVYECGDKDDARADVDTAAAGANILLADGSVNTVNGAYVAKIYKSVELSEDGTKVVDSKKLHKYDGAVYSKMSMNVAGNDGVLNINAENEGLDSDLHLTVNGGVINITSGNDGINTNEDGVSVTTVNGGQLTVTVDGSTGEGDGIDSNGWLVINGGTVHAYACAFSGDAGIDSDMGIQLNGGEVVATGNMLDEIDAASKQRYTVFSLGGEPSAPANYTLKDAEGNALMEVPTVNGFSLLLVSCPALPEGLSTLYDGDEQVASAEPGAGDFGRRPFPGGSGPDMDGHGPADRNPTDHDPTDRGPEDHVPPPLSDMPGKMPPDKYPGEKAK